MITPSKPFKMLISRERLIEKIIADPDDETITAGSNAMTETTSIHALVSREGTRKGDGAFGFAAMMRAGGALGSNDRSALLRGKAVAGSRPAPSRGRKAGSDHPGDDSGGGTPRSASPNSRR